MVIAGIFASSNLSAQKKDLAMSGQKLSISVDFALPTGNAKEIYRIGFGGLLQFQTPIAQNLNFTGSAGYLSFAGEEFPVADKSTIELGARYEVWSGDNRVIPI
ncbi:hypothetical protein H7F33_00340 [Pedobacter sp. PAMC26386]|nr:hypothetical protein H7F33_00340 [Pedobacter sp. PAMC26386]